MGSLICLNLSSVSFRKMTEPMKVYLNPFEKRKTQDQFIKPNPLSRSLIGSCHPVRMSLDDGISRVVKTVPVATCKHYMPNNFPGQGIYMVISQ